MTYDANASLVLPAASRAVTEKLYAPFVFVAIVVPLACVPAQDVSATASLQAYAACSVEPWLYVAPWAGVVSVATGGVTSRMAVRVNVGFGRLCALSPAVHV